MTGKGAETQGARVWALALLIATAAALLGPGVAQAKKAKPLDVTTTVNQGIPDGSAAAEGLLESTVNAGKKFKGLKIRDVNVTLQTTGSAASVTQDLIARLTAPNEATTYLFFALNGQNIGPLTLDDESPLILNNSTVAGFQLGPPWAGTARPGASIFGRGLWLMDDERVRGPWTLSITDGTAGGTSVLNSWRLQVKTGKPYKTE